MFAVAVVVDRWVLEREVSQRAYHELNQNGMRIHYEARALAIQGRGRSSALSYPGLGSFFFWQQSS
jgi:hypothetical protein